MTVPPTSATGERMSSDEMRNLLEMVSLTFPAASPAMQREIATFAEGMILQARKREDRYRGYIEALGGSLTVFDAHNELAEGNGA